MMFPMLIFWALIIAGIVLAVKALSGTSNPIAAQASNAKALDILRERYARGEIDTEEYETRKRGLTN